jgi:hypothetical protein
MPFIFEQNNFTITDPFGRIKFSTSRGQPNIVARISDTISIGNMILEALPFNLTSADDGAGGSFPYLLDYRLRATGSAVRSHTFSWLRTTDIDNIVAFLFYRTTLTSYTGSGVQSVADGNTGGRWAFSPGGTLLRTYITNRPGFDGFYGLSNPFLGGLTLNLTFKVPGFEDQIGVYLTNIIRGEIERPPDGVGVTSNIVITGLDGPSIVAPAVYTDAIVNYVLYLGRTV